METVTVNQKDQLIHLGRQWKTFFSTKYQPLDVLNALFQAVSRDEQRENYVQIISHLAQSVYLVAKDVEEGDLKHAGIWIKDLLVEYYSMSQLAELFMFHAQWNDTLDDYHRTMAAIYDALNNSHKIITGEIQANVN